jgi:hypothetical protein
MVFLGFGCSGQGPFQALRGCAWRQRLGSWAPDRDQDERLTNGIYQQSTELLQGAAISVPGELAR